MASIACGICGLGVRKEGCVVRFLLASHAARLHQICRTLDVTKTGRGDLLRTGADFFHAWTDVQVHDCVAALRPAPRGLLAVEPRLESRRTGWTAIDAMAATYQG